MHDFGPIPTGRFRLQVYRRGRLIETVDDKNLIVVGSRRAMAAQIGGAGTQAITTIGVGTNLTPAAFGNTALTAPVTKALDGVSYPTVNSVQFAFSFGTGDANGTAIGEFGLITAGGLLFARYVRSSALAKTMAISFSSTWTITFP